MVCDNLGSLNLCSDWLNLCSDDSNNVLVWRSNVVGSEVICGELMWLFATCDAMWCDVISFRPVLLRTTKNYASTTKHYSSTTKYYPVLQSITLYYKVLLHQCSVLQSTTPVLQSTIPVVLRTSLTHAIPSESAELLRSAGDMGTEFTIQSSCFWTKLHKNMFMGQPLIVPHAGQQSSMMNEKHVQIKPGVDHPIASVDDLGAYEVAHGNFFHRNSQVAILNKELAKDSLYMRSLPQNGICPSESSQATISLDKFDMCSPVFDSFLTSHHASHHWQQEPNQQLNVAFFSSRCPIWKAELLTRGPLSNQTKWQGKWLSQRTSVAISRTHGDWVVFPCVDWISSTQ